MNTIAANPVNNSIEAAPKEVVTTLAKPAIKTAKADEATGKPVLTWEAVEGAVSYEIRRGAKKSGTYEAVGTATEPVFLDESAEAGKTYYYKLTAIGNNSRSAESAYKSVKCKLAAPMAAIALDESGNPVISWEAVEGAKKYEVYRAASENGKYSKVKTTTQLSYTDAKATTGKTYYYKVKAVASSSSANSAYGNIVSITAE